MMPKAVWEPQRISIHYTVDHYSDGEWIVYGTCSTLASLKTTIARCRALNPNSAVRVLMTDVASLGVLAPLSKDKKSNNVLDEYMDNVTSHFGK